MVRTGVAWAVCAAAMAMAALSSLARAETLDSALAQAYRNNPQLNAQRASLRAVDENVSQALAGYRPRVTGSIDSVIGGVEERGDDLGIVRGAAPLRDLQRDQTHLRRDAVDALSVERCSNVAADPRSVAIPVGLFRPAEECRKVGVREAEERRARSARYAR